MIRSFCATSGGGGGGSFSPGIQTGSGKQYKSHYTILVRGFISKVGGEGESPSHLEYRQEV